MEFEQKDYASSGLGALKKMLNSFALIRGKWDRGQGPWVGRGLLLFSYSVKGEEDGNEFPFLRCMECETSSVDVDETLKCVRLQWAT